VLPLDGMVSTPHPLMAKVSLVKRAADTADATASGGHAVARISPSQRLDALVLLAYLVVAVVVVWPLWSDLSGAHFVASESDQTQFEWYLSYAAHVITHPGSAFHTMLLNPPDGANIMANASVLGLGVPLAPVTLTLGPTVSVAVALTIALAGTATAWFWLLSRRLLPAFGPGEWPPPPDNIAATRAAAATGAAIIGFSPTLVAHAGGVHLNLVSQFLVPFIVWQALTLHHRPVRGGLCLGLLIAWQIFISGEILLMTAMAIGVFIVVRIAQRPRSAKVAAWRYLGGCAVAVTVTLLIAAYPLWMQFRGPQSYADLPYNAVPGAKVPALVGYSTESVGGVTPLPRGLVLNPAEQNGFFGLPLLVLSVVAAGWLWRRSARARAVAITGAVFLLLSIGSDLASGTEAPAVPGPWSLIERLPVVEMVPAGRLTLVVTVCIAICLACLIYRLRTARWLLAGSLVAVLLPIAPTPLTVDARASLPAFFIHGHWERYVEPGHTLVSAPRADHTYDQPIRWQMQSDFRFRINGGYFMSPQDTERHGWYTPPLRRSEEILRRAAWSADVQIVSTEDRRDARDDLRAWRADVVVLDSRHPSAEAVRVTADDLYGMPGQLIAGVWVWDVRGIA
jgi:hypothetical protein